MNITQNKPTPFLLPLLLLLLCGQAASAYYDPGVQRWINRDPLGDGASGASYYVQHHARPPESVSTLLRAFESHGEANLYTFVLNSSVNSIDWLGLDDCGKSECNQYPPGALRFICLHTPCDPWSNCVRACLLNYWDPNKKQYCPGLVKAHISCWAGCALDRGFDP
jgi:hypothetical protein